MRWGVKDKADQRMRFVIEALKERRTMSQLCREFEISRPTGYLWLKRYREGGKTLSAVVEKSRRPFHSPQRTEEATEKKVLNLRQEEGWGSRKIRHVLERDEGIRLARMTVQRILERHNQIADLHRHRPATRRFQRSEPNQLWQMDFKGQLPMGSRQCYPLSVLDDYSRFLIGLQALEGTGTEGVHRTLIRVFEHYGLPDEMLMDHGVPWWNAINQHGLTRLSVNLIKQAIRLRFSGLRHPQTQGKVERFHGSLLRSIKHHNRWPTSLHAWQQEFARFRQSYNHRRPHESLDMEVPASRYRHSLRQYQVEPKAWDYPVGSVVRRVNTQGQLSYKGWYLFVSQALDGELVRIQQVKQTWIISFRHMWIREIHLDTGTSVPLMAVAEEAMPTDAAMENP